MTLLIDRLHKSTMMDIPANRDTWDIPCYIARRPVYRGQLVTSDQMEGFVRRFERLRFRGAKHSHPAIFVEV